MLLHKTMANTFVLITMESRTKIQWHTFRGAADREALEKSPFYAPLVID